MVRVEGQGGGELSDVADERGVLQRRRGGLQEAQLAHLAVRRAGGSVGALRAAGGALLLRRVLLLHPETHHLRKPERTGVGSGAVVATRGQRCRNTHVHAELAAAAVPVLLEPRDQLLLAEELQGLDLQQPGQS